MLLWALLAFTAPVILSSCKKDDDDEFPILSPVAGEYVGAETCGPNPPSGYFIQVYNPSDNDPSKAFIENIYGLSDYTGVRVAFLANVSGNTLTLPDANQQIIADQDTFNIRIGADGTLNGNKITLNFRISGDLGDDTCQFVGDRRYIGPAF